VTASEKEIKLLEDFSVRLIDDLVDIGFPSCREDYGKKSSLEKKFFRLERNGQGWFFCPPLTIY